MLENDVILSKISNMKNCLKTIQKVTGGDADRLDDFIVQDVVVLNLQRAIQAMIDIANVIIAEKGFKLPASYKDSFRILYSNGVIDKTLMKRIEPMIGFRNIAVHDYQALNIDILKSIFRQHLNDFETFYTVIYHFMEKK